MSDDDLVAKDAPDAIPGNVRDGNPYASAAPPQSDAPIIAEIVEPTAPTPAKLRIWPALIVGILALPAAFVVATVVFVVAMLSELEVSALSKPAALDAWLKQFAASRWGFLVLTLPGQLVFLSAACGAACLSPVGFRERLRLVKGTMPLWAWGVLCLATPAIGVLSTMVLSLFTNEMSESLQMLSDMFRSHRGAYVVVVVATVAVLPGFAEEALFRGYVQSRLLQRLPPVVAIGICSILFAIAHVDPMHVVAVWPLGLWLGVVAWRSDSLFPAALCHMFNNALAIFLSHFSDPSAVFVADKPTIGVLVIAGVALLASIPLLLKFGPGLGIANKAQFVEAQTGLP
jgi:membrane protease YdiL (CAAX protease family)